MCGIKLKFEETNSLLETCIEYYSNNMQFNLKYIEDSRKYLEDLFEIKRDKFQNNNFIKQKIIK